MNTQSQILIPPTPPLLLVANDVEGMDIFDVQEFYDRLCKKYKVLSVKAFLVHNDEHSLKLAGRKLDYEGLYIEWPFRKIFLNSYTFSVRTVYHAIFHHLNPNLSDGSKFEKLLDVFMEEEYL